MAKCTCHLLSILTKSNVKRRITINPNTNTTANTPKSLTEKCEGNILFYSVVFVPGRILRANISNGAERKLGPSNTLVPGSLVSWDSLLFVSSWLVSFAAVAADWTVWNQMKKKIHFVSVSLATKKARENKNNPMKSSYKKCKVCSSAG